MLLKKISRKLLTTGLIIFLLALVGSCYLMQNPDPKMVELPERFLESHLVSLYLQTFVFILLYRHVLLFRSNRLLIGVRQKTNQMIAVLLLLATIYIALFCLGLIIPYLLSGCPLFQNGNPAFGWALVLLHIGVLLFLMWLLVGAYNLQRPMFLLLLVIVLGLAYHYYLEPKLLIMYSPLYDPIYRAIHHIYYT